MPRRRYDHYCGIAHALDHLGERWALLIIRELLAGPRRYSDLLANLPGISTDVLATRLRELEGDGLISRRQDGPRAYELTRDGAAIQPILDALAGWGLARLGPPAPGDAVRAHWLAAPLARRLSRDPGSRAAPGHPAAVGDRAAVTVEVHLNEAVFYLSLDQDGGWHADATGAAPAETPTATLTTTAETAAALAAGHTDLRRAVTAGAAKLEGPEEVLEALLAG
jgi:DNA-binding HxlR family transcriptional regulator